MTRNPDAPDIHTDFACRVHGWSPLVYFAVPVLVACIVMASAAFGCPLHDSLPVRYCTGRDDKEQEFRQSTEVAPVRVDYNGHQSVDLPPLAGP